METTERRTEICVALSRVASAIGCGNPSTVVSTDEGLELLQFILTCSAHSDKYASFVKEPKQLICTQQDRGDAHIRILGDNRLSGVEPYEPIEPGESTQHCLDYYFIAFCTPSDSHHAVSLRTRCFA